MQSVNTGKLGGRSRGHGPSPWATRQPSVAMLDIAKLYRLRAEETRGDGKGRREGGSQSSPPQFQASLQATPASPVSERQGDLKMDLR